MFKQLLVYDILDITNTYITVSLQGKFIQTLTSDVCMMVSINMECIYWHNTSKNNNVKFIPNVAGRQIVTDPRVGVEAEEGVDVAVVWEGVMVLTPVENVNLTGTVEVTDRKLMLT